MSLEMLISVCIGTIRPDTVAATIEAVRRQTHTNWELLVVPQGSDRALFDLLEAASQSDRRIRIVETDAFGRSRALNLAVRHSRGEVLAFTDDDCEPDANWLDEIGCILRQDGDVGSVGGDVTKAPNKKPWMPSTCPAADVIDCTYHPDEHGFRAPQGFYMIGANMAYRRDAFDAIGPFDQHLGVGTPFGSCEDVDHVIRAELKNITMVTSKRVRVAHSHGRRYGLRRLLAHHRAYARGQGALLAKLQLMEHRLGSEWDRQPRRIAEQIVQAARSPYRFAMAEYMAPHAADGYRTFRAQYAVNEVGVSIIKGVEETALA